MGRAVTAVVGPSTERRTYRWIVWSSIVLTLVSLIGAGISLSIIERRLVEAAGHTVAQAAASGAQKIDALLEERYGDVSIVAQSKVLQGNDREAMTAELLRLQSAHTVYASFLMADSNGRVIAATDPEWVGRPVEQTRWFRSAKAHHGVVMQDPGRALEAGGSMAVSFASAVLLADGRVRGVVAGWVDLLLLEGLLRRTVAALQQQWGLKLRSSMCSFPNRVSCSPIHCCDKKGMRISKS